MPDWSKSMKQTFEYYIVDPGTWKDKKRLDNVKSASIQWDEEADTLGSATIDIDDAIGENYIRIYLVTVQNGVTEKHPLGTFLIQTPGLNFDGKNTTISADAYTPLLELKENPPPIGFAIPKNKNIMDEAYELVSSHLRAPVVKPKNSKTLIYDFVANTDDTWLTLTKDLIANAQHKFGLDELSRIIFEPKQDTASLQPVWTYTDDNSSILYPDANIDRDLYNIPNVVEVLYSTNDKIYYARVVNDKASSPVSIINRGREILHRVTDPDLNGISYDSQTIDNLVKEYAEKLLSELSSLEYTINYTHGYCPVRIGDCVRFNHKRFKHGNFNLMNVKAKVISQSIKCEPGCPVSEKAVYTIKLWE